MKTNLFVMFIVVFAALTVGVNAYSDDWCNYADMNHDGSVNDVDKGMFAAQMQEVKDYANPGICTEENDWCQFVDYNRNGYVELSDIAVFAEEFGRTDCNPEDPSVPEFSTLAAVIAMLIAISGFLILRRKN